MITGLLTAGNWNLPQVFKAYEGTTAPDGRLTIHTKQTRMKKGGDRLNLEPRASCQK